jgi:hypothetical protein
MKRVLVCGLCLIAFHASSGFAQTIASGADNPVAGNPAARDGTAKMSNTIPEIVRPQENLAQSKAVSSPDAVLTPPTVDLRFLRAIRLDWDHLGDSAR